MIPGLNTVTAPSVKCDRTACLVSANHETLHLFYHNPPQSDNDINILHFCAVVKLLQVSHGLFYSGLDVT